MVDAAAHNKRRQLPQTQVLRLGSVYRKTGGGTHFAQKPREE